METETDLITAILHKHGALAFWDFASCAPYVEIRMNSVGIPEASKDAVFFSGHKFIGGLQSPGVLIAKKFLFKNRTPLKSGGGTVFFVRPESHRFLKSIEVREEGGTPDVLGSIRLGLAFQLKIAVGCEKISERENEIKNLVFNRWISVPNLILLGPKNSAQKLPIFSFVIRHKNLLLHQNFVCALLDNLFGIQTRAGCMCAGPYAQY